MPYSTKESTAHSSPIPVIAGETPSTPLPAHGTTGMAESTAHPVIAGGTPSTPPPVSATAGVAIVTPSNGTPSLAVPSPWQSPCVTPNRNAVRVRVSCSGAIPDGPLPIPDSAKGLALCTRVSAHEGEAVGSVRPLDLAPSSETDTSSLLESSGSLSVTVPNIQEILGAFHRIRDYIQGLLDRVRNYPNNNELQMFIAQNLGFIESDVRLVTLRYDILLRTSYSLTLAERVEVLRLMIQVEHACVELNEIARRTSSTISSRHRATRRALSFGPTAVSSSRSVTVVTSVSEPLSSPPVVESITHRLLITDRAPTETLGAGTFEITHSLRAASDSSTVRLAETIDSDTRSADLTRQTTVLRPIVTITQIRMARAETPPISPINEEPEARSNCCLGLLKRLLFNK